MTKLNLRLEKWSSSDNRQEEHFFLSDGLREGEKESAYVFGYNPEFVSQEQFQKILAIIEEES